MGNIMSNAKLKEQIEAAKIALVHPAETRSSDETPSTSGTVTQITKISSDDADPHVESVATMPRPAANTETSSIGVDTITQSEFEKLEARLQGLENQIKNQQRDLHTLLQKLRDITAKSRSVVEPKKGKSTKKWLAGATLCMVGFGAIYHWLGAELITDTIYQATGLMVALIDTLAGKI